MRFRRTSVVVVAVVALGLATRTAGAQADPIRQANDLAAHGDHRAAVRVLREAQVEAPSARVDLNLAMALSELGQLREARRLLRRVVSSDANPLIVDAAREQLGQVDAQVPALTVTVEGAADELRVGADVVPVEGPTVRLELDPGEHHLELRERGGEVLARATVELARAERANLRLGRTARPAAARRVSRAPSPSAEPRPSPAPPSAREAAATTPPPSPPPIDLSADVEPARDDDALPWILLGTGAAAVVIGAVVVGAVVASQPAATMGDVPPIVLGGS